MEQRVHCRHPEELGDAEVGAAGADDFSMTATRLDFASAMAGYRRPGKCPLCPASYALQSPSPLAARRSPRAAPWACAPRAASLFGLKLIVREVAATVLLIRPRSG